MSDTWPATDLTLTHHVSSAGDKKGSVFTPRDYTKQIVLLKCKITMVVNEKYLSAILLNLNFSSIFFNGLFCMQKQNYKQNFTSSSLWRIDSPYCPLRASQERVHCRVFFLFLRFSEDNTASTKHATSVSIAAVVYGRPSVYSSRGFSCHTRVDVT